MTDETFVIDNDQKADWALRKIREAREELERLKELAEAEIAELEQKIKDEQEASERRCSYLKAALELYFDGVEHKRTKTQESYKLLHGSLVRKAGGIDYQRDDDKLTDWMQEHDYDDMVTTKVSPQWGNFKRLLSADPETGVVTVAATGEVVDGLKAVQKPDTFDVKY